MVHTRETGSDKSRERALSVFSCVSASEDEGTGFYSQGTDREINQ